MIDRDVRNIAAEALWNFMKGSISNYEEVSRKFRDGAGGSV